MYAELVGEAKSPHTACKISAVDRIFIKSKKNTVRDRYAYEAILSANRGTSAIPKTIKMIHVLVVDFSRFTEDLDCGSCSRGLPPIECNLLYK